MKCVHCPQGLNLSSLTELLAQLQTLTGSLHWTCLTHIFFKASGIVSTLIVYWAVSAANSSTVTEHFLMRLTCCFHNKSSKNKWQNMLFVQALYCLHDYLALQNHYKYHLKNKSVSWCENAMVKVWLGFRERIMVWVKITPLLSLGDLRRHGCNKTTCGWDYWMIMVMIKRNQHWLLVGNRNWAAVSHEVINFVDPTIHCGLLPTRTWLPPLLLLLEGFVTWT